MTALSLIFFPCVAHVSAFRGGEGGRGFWEEKWGVFGCVKGLFRGGGQFSVFFLPYKVKKFTLSDLDHRFFTLSRQNIFIR